MTRTNCVNSVIGSTLEIETELPFKKFWKKINLWQLKSCDAVTIKGIKDKNYLLSHKIIPEKLFYFNGAIDIEKFSFNKGERKTDILFVGNFYELKGPDRILKIIHLLIDKFPNLKVVMVGNGVMFEESRKLATTLGINNIDFPGYQANTVHYFQEAKLLLMPSRSDSLPTSMLEAMSCGCVPVISDVGNVKEAALHNVNSKVIADYSDLKSFADAITELLTEESRRFEFSLAARKMVETNYSVRAQSILAENIINYLNI
ncbi:MAG: glycosyltransferase family 4 protein [Bacteroidales bacterium]|nr:glycosyltransferase family 4 protein [Bacteroidales bacterium]